jgi:polysaccharide pyruvyl transferase WcaK-like protein
VSERRPRRAAIVGFIGYGNLGDEMILAGIEALLAPTTISVTILIGGPDLAQTAAFRGARRLSPWRSLPTPRAIRELRRVDLLLVGGGGLFNDYWPFLIPRYLAWVIAARVAGARVAWLGVGVGPIRRRPWRWLARLAARLSDRVLVRDAASAALLGGPSTRIRVIPDPALFVSHPADRQPEPVLGLIVRGPVHDDDAQATVLLDLLVEAAAAGRSVGLEPRVMVMAPSADRAIAERLADRLGRSAARPAIVALGPTAAELWRQLGGLRACVSVRLHGVLLSALAGVPCVPVAYDDKVTLAAEELGIGDLVLHPWRDARDRPADRLAAAQDPELMRIVAERVSALRGQAEAVRGMLP